jgi:GNAT superfamily N-acetyltransferase
MRVTDMSFDVGGRLFFLARRRFDDLDSTTLLQKFHQEQIDRYGHADPLDDDVSSYSPPNGLLLIAYDGATAVGCVGHRWLDCRTGLAEIGRLYVAPKARGHGLGTVLLSEIENHASLIGASRLMLETGVHNHAAVHPFVAAGYRAVTPYVEGRDPAINRAFVKNGMSESPED